MSMQIPLNSELIRNTVPIIPHESPSDLRSLAPTSLASFEHEEFAEKHADKMIGMTFASAVIASGTSIMSSSMVGIGSVIEGVLIGSMTGAGIGAIGMFGMIVAGGIIANFPALQSDMPLMPADSSVQLKNDIFQQALKSGIMPDKFIDPIMRDPIETPVAFTDDSTGTIYNLETVKSLQKSNITRNPMGGGLPLDFEKLVYLPEVKKQIDEIRKIEGGGDI